MEGNEHWSNEFQHESLATPETKTAFVSAMGKYGSKEDAILGGFNAMKAMGKPFRLPESMDKLPDDNVRSEFRTQAMKVLGIEAGVDKIEDLLDLDLKAELKDGDPNENLANAFKKFAAENKMPKSLAQKLVAFNNQMATTLKTQMAEQQKAQKLDAATKTNEALIAHFHSKEEVEKLSEQLRRTIQNKAGLSAEEYERVGEVMADSMLTKDPVMARAMISLLAPLSPEGNTENGKGGNPSPKNTDPDEGSNTYKALGWSK